MCSPKDVNGDGSSDTVGAIEKTFHSKMSGADVTRSSLPHFLDSVDGGHDATDHCNADLCSGITDDPDVTAVVVYEVGTKATADTALNHIVDKYAPP